MKYDTMPLACGLAMPVQQLGVFHGVKALVHRDLRTQLSRAFLILITCFLTYAGCYTLYQLQGLHRISPAYVVFFILFFFTFLWISFAAASAIIGFISLRIARSWKEEPVTGTRTAIVMPLYNEDVIRSLSGLEAIAHELYETGNAQFFDIVILSDSTDPHIVKKETVMYEGVRHRLSGIMNVWYRNRTKNTARKAGNIGDFIINWGSCYDYMVVLDADSLMTAETICTMVRRLQGDRSIGILQTVPALCGDCNFFARLQQFASRVYGNVNAAGIAAWAGDEGNYWGHNAIIRMTAFASSCGLPVLSGRKPFGGYIFSHDFVEAALMRRAGWKVCIASDLQGSWEESPPSLLDQTRRDRRWTQGNLQHLKVITAKGLTIWNRIHFLVGIMGYVSSLLWLLLIMVGSMIMIGNHDHRPFTGIYYTKMGGLFIFTMIVLFIPKIAGWVSTMMQSSVCRSCGGRLAVSCSVCVEIFFAILFSPITMLFNVKNIIEIIFGMDSGWKVQRRSLTKLGIQEAWSAHAWQCISGLFCLIMIQVYYPSYFFCYVPVFFGLIISVPLSLLSSSMVTGKLFIMLHLLLIPEETHIPRMITLRDRLEQELRAYYTEYE